MGNRQTTWLNDLKSESVISLKMVPTRSRKMTVDKIDKVDQHHPPSQEPTKKQMRSRQIQIARKTIRKLYDSGHQLREFRLLSTAEIGQMIGFGRMLSRLHRNFKLPVLMFIHSTGRQTSSRRKITTGNDGWIQKMVRRKYNKL